MRSAMTPSRTSTLLMFGLITATATIADWRQTSGPAGGATSQIACDGTDLLTAGGPGELFRSTDGGATWTLLLGALPVDASVLQLVSDYYGTWFASDGYHIWRSADGGFTWADAGTGGAFWNAQLHMFDGTPWMIAAGPGTQGDVYRWSNAGQQWSLVTTPESPQSLLVEGDFILAGNATAYDPRIMRSFDGGATWESSDPNLPLLGFDDFARSGDAIVAISAFQEVWRSYDNGESWTRTVAPGTLSPRQLDVVGGELFMFEYNGKLRRSVDQGASWQLVGSGLGSISSITKHGSRLLVTGDKVYRSDNDGASWASSNEGIIATYITNLHRLGARIGAVESGRQGMHFTSDSGATWALDPAALPAGVDVLTVFAYDNSTIFLGTASHGVYRSTNGGQSWNQVNSGWPTYHSTAFSTAPHRPVSFARIGNDIFAATGSSPEVVGGTIGTPYTTTSGAGVYRSSNLGQSWQAVRTGIPIRMTNPLYGNPIYASGIMLGQFGQTLLLSTQDYGIYRSTNMGASWQAANTGLPMQGSNVAIRAADFAQANGAILVASSFVSYQNPHAPLYGSTDDGQTWTPWTSDLGQQRGIRGLVTIGGRMIAGMGHVSGVADPAVFYESSDGGATWTPLEQNVDSLVVNDLIVDGQALLASTPLGVWRLASTKVGDLNCDGSVDFFDIDPFVAALSSESYAGAFPGCDATLADADRNGAIDFFDIDAFVARLGL